MSIEEANITIQKAIELYGYEETMKTLYENFQLSNLNTFLTR